MKRIYFILVVLCSCHDPKAEINDRIQELKTDLKIADLARQEKLAHIADLQAGETANQAKAGTIDNDSAVSDSISIAIAVANDSVQFYENRIQEKNLLIDSLELALKKY